MHYPGDLVKMQILVRRSRAGPKAFFTSSPMMLELPVLRVTRLCGSIAHSSRTAPRTLQQLKESSKPRFDTSVPAFLCNSSPTFPSTDLPALCLPLPHVICSLMPSVHFCASRPSAQTVSLSPIQIPRREDPMGSEYHLSCTGCSCRTKFLHFKSQIILTCHSGANHWPP